MKKSHQVTHEKNQRRGGFYYYHYTVSDVTVKISSVKKWLL